MTSNANVKLYWKCLLKFDLIFLIIHKIFITTTIVKLILSHRLLRQIYFENSVALKRNSSLHAHVALTTMFSILFISYTLIYSVFPYFCVKCFQKCLLQFSSMRQRVKSLIELCSMKTNHRVFATSILVDPDSSLIWLWNQPYGFCHHHRSRWKFDRRIIC